MEQDVYEAFIRTALAEDIGQGDHSTLACIDPEARGRAKLLVKEEGILAGITLAEKIFRFQEPGIRFECFLQDGATIQKGDIAFEVGARVHTILKSERLVLNCMQRMSGIATLTRKFCKKLDGYHTRLLDTRKTTPNFRLVEKEAVRIGGGLNHRMGLYDMIMLKDNHIDYSGGIEQALEKTLRYLNTIGLSLKIEVEARSLDEVSRIVATGHADRIMLDNFSPGDLVDALRLIPPGIESEASGGITLENVEQFAKTGVDFVSVGAVIHHAVSIDLSLKAIIDSN